MSTLYSTVEYDKRDLKEKLLKVLQVCRTHPKSFSTLHDGHFDPTSSSSPLLGGPGVATLR